MKWIRSVSRRSRKNPHTSTKPVMRNRNGVGSTSPRFPGMEVQVARWPRRPVRFEKRLARRTTAGHALCTLKSALLERSLIRGLRPEETIPALRGAPPELVVHVPRGEGGEVPEPMRAPVPEPVWDALVRRSQHFDRSLAGQSEPADPTVIMVCLHSWVYTVEAIDPPLSEGRSPTVRRDTEDACEDGLAAAFADELERAAVELLPACAACCARCSRWRRRRSEPRDPPCPQ